ncbi:MAG: hypothetical protein K2W96_22365, partial [Gemmataceae bacterium]|nr:hypothetical protein [Gemmataceae bacterium]
EVLACFCNGDDVLPERGFRLDAVVGNTAVLRGWRGGKDLIAVGLDGDQAFCIDRRGSRKRAVWLTTTNDSQDLGAADLAAWLASVADLEDEEPPRPPSPFVQLTFWPDPDPPQAPQGKVWRLA